MFAFLIILYKIYITKKNNSTKDRRILGVVPEYFLSPPLKTYNWGGQFTKEPSPLYLAATGIISLCLNLNLDIVFFINLNFSASGMVSGATPHTHMPLTTPLAEKS